MGILNTIQYKNVFSQVGNRLIWHFDAETLWIEAWGNNSLRVRCTRQAQMDESPWALLEPVGAPADIAIGERSARITCGNLTAEVSSAGLITFKNQAGRVLLKEQVRNRMDVTSDSCSALEIEGRELRPILGGDYRLTLRFESDPLEKLYGMGQYQMPYLNLKGCELELAQRNSQASVPFVVSSLGYGFLWNNPAVGSVTFGRNLTRWTAESTKQMDYWITAGDTPDAIEQQYAQVTGHVPMMPEWAMGFWQCKLRYQIQEELLHVAREYKRQGLPIDVIVIDFFHCHYAAGDISTQVILNIVPGFKCALHHIVLIGLALGNVLIQLLVCQAAEQGQILLSSLLHRDDHRRIQFFLRIRRRRTAGKRKKKDGHTERKPDSLYILFHISATSP